MAADTMDMESEKCKLVSLTREFHLYSNGMRFLNGLSSSYSMRYSDELEGIVVEDDLKTIINRLNDTIVRFWPCVPCLVFGFCCAPCAIFPFFPPNICVGEAEKQARNYLKQVSLKAIYYDRQISFELKKGNCMTSYISVSYPAHLASLNHTEHSSISFDAAATKQTQPYDARGPPILKKDT